MQARFHAVWKSPRRGRPLRRWSKRGAPAGAAVEDERAVRATARVLALDHRRQFGGGYRLLIPAASADPAPSGRPRLPPLPLAGPWSSMGGSPKRLFALTYFRASNAPKRLLTVARASAYLRSHHVFLVQIGNNERHREPRLDSGANQAASQTRRRTDEGADDGSGAQIRGSRDRLLHAPGYRPRRGLGAGQQLHGDGDRRGGQEGGREGEVLVDGNRERPGGR